MENNVKNQLVGHIYTKLLIDSDLSSDMANRSIEIAYNDSYLLDLMEDWLKEKNDYIKNEMLNEIINYTDEIQRRKSL